MVVPALMLLFAALPAPHDSAGAPAPDSTHGAPPHIVRRLEEFLVRAPRLHDPRSAENVHLISPAALRALPVDGLAGALALQAGVVAEGEALHVHGGRAGELGVEIAGLSLGEPLRERAPELPLLAVESAMLVSGGPDAEFGGALAGVLAVRTVDPGPAWSGEARWSGDGRRDTHFDRVSARLGGPLGVLGLGAVMTGEARLDDTFMPALRTQGRHDVLGGSFGWRADDRMLGDFKLAPVSGGRGVTLELIGSRTLEAPYNPMWSLDGWTTPCDDPMCILGPHFSSTPLPGYTRYRAADHAVMTDQRRLAAILSLSLPRGRDRMSAALGVSRARSITSLGARDDESYLTKARAPLFGIVESATSDPILAYGGDEPYFRKSAGDRWTARADYERWSPRGNRGKAGLGATYDAVRLRELDVTTFNSGLDSLRAYRAFAPGAFAYAQGRWVFEGMVLNGGLRAEYFTAGPQAATQSFGAKAPGTWSLSPRIGVAYPISVRDVFSLAYARIQQNPGRDFLYDDRTKPNNYRPLGNPAIAPATDVSWQAAVKHLFSDHWSMQSAIFGRDFYGEVGARNFAPPSSVPLFRYDGADAGHADGWELSLMRSAPAGAHLELHYTWMEARGAESLEEGVPTYLRTGARPVPIGDHPLNWDRRHTIGLTAWWDAPRRWSLAWTTRIGSGLPWTPAARRQLAADLSDLNTRRFKWSESSALAARWLPPRLGHVTVGLDVRNVFDHRDETRATLSGYPQTAINTIYDDYGAFRTETGLPGGAYWDDRDGDGVPGWVRVHDPRLLAPPRTVRLSLGAAW